MEEKWRQLMNITENDYIWRQSINDEIHSNGIKPAIENKEGVNGRHSNSKYKVKGNLSYLVRKWLCSMAIRGLIKSMAN